MAAATPSSACSALVPTDHHDGVVCRQYRPGPTDVVTVPLIPAPLRQSILQQVHDAPGAGHLGVDKALE